MSTRGRIGMYLGNGNTISVYEHYDGYLQGVGAILKLYYSDEDKIKELIKQGDISSLDKFIGEKHDFDNRPDGWCTFYKRDRGEDGVDAVEMPLDDLARQRNITTCGMVRSGCTARVMFVTAGTF